jgi:hypothetical protein
MKSISSNIYTRKKSTYTEEEKSTRWERKKEEEQWRGRNSGFEMPTRLSSWDRPLSLVCILSAETHAALRAAAQSERYKRQREEKYIYFYFLLFFLCVYLFRNDCPRNCGRTGPLGLTGRSSSCVCAVWGPLWLYATSNSLQRDSAVIWGRRRKKGQTRALIRNRFLFFPFGKMLIVILSRRVHLFVCCGPRSFPHITADSENSRDIQ